MTHCIVNIDCHLMIFKKQNIFYYLKSKILIYCKVHAVRLFSDASLPFSLYLYISFSLTQTQWQRSISEKPLLLANAYGHVTTSVLWRGSVLQSPLQNQLHIYITLKCVCTETDFVLHSGVPRKFRNIYLNGNRKFSFFLIFIWNTSVITFFFLKNIFK